MRVRLYKAASIKFGQPILLSEQCPIRDCSLFVKSETYEARYYKIVTKD
jgi:hypothetical protein